MKTFKYGGRKSPPSKEELNQLVVSLIIILIILYFNTLLSIYSYFLETMHWCIFFLAKE